MSDTNLPQQGGSMAASQVVPGGPPQFTGGMKAVNQEPPPQFVQPQGLGGEEECQPGYEWDDGKGGCVPIEVDPPTGLCPLPSAPVYCEQTGACYPPGTDCANLGGEPPEDPGGGGGGGGDKPWQPGVDTNIDYNWLTNRWPGMTPEERGLLDTLTNLAGMMGSWSQQLFDMGYADLARASEFFNTLMGKGGRYQAQQMLAPTIENIREAYSGVGVGAGYLGRSGQGVNLMGEAGREEARAVAGLYSGVQAGAAQALQGTGQTAMGLALPYGQAAAGLYAGVGGVLATERATEAQFNLGVDQFNSQMQMQADLGELGAEVSLYGIDKQFEVGMANVGAQYAALADRMTQFNQQMAFSREQWDWSRQFQSQQLAQQSQSSKWGMFGSIFGTAGGALLGNPAVFGSSIRVKHEIADPTPPREALQHVVQAAGTLRSYRYKSGEDVIPNGLILELAPRYAMANGTYLSIQTALGDLMASVKVLTEENAELRSRLVQVEKEASHG